MSAGASKVILETEWQKFEARAIPATAPEVWRTEMRKSFYAGANAIMNVLKALGDSGISEEVGELVLQRLEEEIQAYVASLNPSNDTSERFYRQ